MVTTFSTNSKSASNSAFFYTHIPFMKFFWSYLHFLQSLNENVHETVKKGKLFLTTIFNFFSIWKNISDLNAFERGCQSWALKLLQFFKVFGTPCRSYESLSKLGALTVHNNIHSSHWLEYALVYSYRFSSSGFQAETRTRGRFLAIHCATHIATLHHVKQYLNIFPFV